MCLMIWEAFPRMPCNTSLPFNTRMAEAIHDNDVVSRSIIDPKDFDESGVLCLRKSFQFSHQNHYNQSVNCHRLLHNDVKAIHDLGLKKQELDRENGKTNRTYVGYVESEVSKVRGISLLDGQTFFEVSHHKEKGNNAHCHIKLHFKQKNDFTAAINQLIDVFSELHPYKLA